MKSSNKLKYLKLEERKSFQLGNKIIRVIQTLTVRNSFTWVINFAFDAPKITANQIEHKFTMADSPFLEKYQSTTKARHEIY